MTIALAASAWADSEVFDGDPTDPSDGHAYEILPGAPLVKPGPDGILGTADDEVHSDVIGDIDLVVRSGSPAADPAIPPPSALAGRAALPAGVAGAVDGGGVAIPFTAFLCGASCYGDDASAPYGYALQTLDMDDFPVIVAAFADLDGDGFIGPRTGWGSRPYAISLQLRELEPVGRAVAHFDDGVAQGQIAIRVGRPASQGGLAIALVAAAASGPFSQGKYNGVIGSGSGIATALPFLPQKDFTRFLRATAEPAGPDTTIYPLVQFASLPATAVAGYSFALPLDGSSGTIDAAVVYSQPAVRVALREEPGPLDMRSSASGLVFGTSGSARRKRLRLLPVDRLGNPADPPAGLTVKLRATPPLRIARPGAGASEVDVALTRASGRNVVLKVPRSAAATAGAVSIERDGVVVAAHAYRIDARANRLPPDVVVPSATVPTIQAAIDAASDVNGDGRAVVGVGPGLFRENLLIDHAIVLQGAGADRTVVQGDGTGPVVSVVGPDVEIRGITAVGGTTGFALAGTSTALAESRAWHNDGAGMTATGSAIALWRSGAIDNTGDGVLAQNANDLVCEEGAVRLNGGAGVRIAGGSGHRIESSSIASNTGSGVVFEAARLATASGNRRIVNLGSGIETSGSSGCDIASNLSATNDGDGLHMSSPDGDAVWSNAFDNNGQYGIWLRGSMSADFALAPGTQVPIGDNAAAANREGSVSLPGN